MNLGPRPFLASIHGFLTLRDGILHQPIEVHIFERVVVSSDESKLKSVIVFYPRVCNVWFKGYLFLTSRETCKSKKSINYLCFILSFYYNVSLLEEMLIFVKRSLTKKLWIRGDKNFVFFIFFLYFSISLLL